MRRALFIVLLLSALIPIPAAARDESCGDALPPRLTPGREARAVGASIELYALSQPDSDVLTHIPAGEVFHIVGTPRCGHDGFFWFPAEYDSQEGWIAESADGEYLAEPSGGTVALADVLPSDTVLIAQTGEVTYALFDMALNPLVEITAPEEAYHVIIPHIAFIRGDTLFFFAGDSVKAYRASGESAVFRRPAVIGYTHLFMPSPDGQQVAWLVQVARNQLPADECLRMETCGTRDYELYVTDADGTETLLSAWTDEAYKQTFLHNWFGGQIILDHRLWGVVWRIPRDDGGLTAVDDQTSEHTEITPPTEDDELLSIDGRWLARATHGAAPVTLTDRATGETWTASAADGTLAGELSFSPSGRYLAYGLYAMAGWAVGRSEVWIYDTETGQNTLLARTERPASEEAADYAYVGAWLSDDLPVLMHGKSLSIVQLSTGASVLIDHVYIPFSNGRKIERLLGTLDTTG